MNSKTSTWFETKVKYDKLQENGDTKSVREQIVVEALCFTEAEGKTFEAMKPYMSGEFQIVEEKIAAYHEVIFSEDAEADKYYKVKIETILLDEKTQKEKRTPIYYLVQGASVEDARRNIREYFMGSSLDQELVSVSKTNIMDVFRHEG